jgi:hypothetical protein
MFQPQGKKPRPNVFDTSPRATNRERGDAHERDTAKKVGGRTQPNSGASPWLSYKGDVSTERFVMQCKTTDKNRYTLNEQVIGEIYRQATLVGKDPAIVIRLEAVKAPIPNEWVAVPISVWITMTEDTPQDT